MRLWHKVTPHRRGAILPLVALSLVGIMGLMVLAIDVGSLQLQRRMAQTAADAGATAGAHEIYRQQPDDSVPASVHSETTRNGFTHGANNVTVTVHHGPDSGPHAGDDQYVEVRISRPITTFFGAILGRSSVTIDVRSVAGIVSPAENCIYTLDPDDTKALNVSGATTRLNADCGLQVNSNHPGNAVLVESGATLEANSLAVVGAIDQSGGTIILDPGPASTGVPPAVDPLAYLQMPYFDPNQCDYPSTKVDSYSVITTLNPGIYCSTGDPAIEITSNGTVLLNPGLYILRGGGLKQSGGLLAGTGVTFINTNARDADGGASKFGKFEMGSGSWAGGSVGAWLGSRYAAVGSLSAMTTGNLKGILVYQDPAAGLAGVVYENVIASNSVAAFVGTLYFPTQPIELGASGSTTTIDGGVVAATVKITSGSVVNVDMTTGLTGEPLIKRVTIVE